MEQSGPSCSSKPGKGPSLGTGGTPGPGLGRKIHTRWSRWWGLSFRVAQAKAGA